MTASIVHLTLVVSRSPLAREVDAFLVDCQARGLSPKTLDFYANQLKYATEYLRTQDVRAVTDITPVHLRRQYLVSLGSKKPATVHAAYRALRAFLNWRETECEPDGWRNPVGKVKPPRLCQRPGNSPTPRPNNSPTPACGTS